VTRAVEPKGQAMNSQNADSSTSFYSGQIYEYDFLTGELVEVSPSFPFPKKVLSTVSEIAKVFIVSGAKTSWEFTGFLFSYLVFAQKRLVSFVYLLESIKDLAVKVVMWRRGFLFKPTVHGGVLAISSVALVVGGLFVNSVEPADFTRDLVLASENTTETIIPEDRPRSEVIKYEVAGGESLSQIAKNFNISVDSIKWENDIRDVDSIKPGDTLAIPPVTGVVYKVRKGDTISSIAETFSANAQTIATYPFNYITDSLKLTVGQTLIIPGGKKPEPTPLPYSNPGYNQPIFYAAGGNGLFSWPVRGSLNQYPSWWHPAIDIGAAYGSSVAAAGGGKVVAATWGNYGYGNYVSIDHGNGYSTTYAHLSTIKVSAGQTVGRGQAIGNVGCTGFCTGPHLHFAVFRGGSVANPLSLLP